MEPGTGQVLVTRILTEWLWKISLFKG